MRRCFYLLILGILLFLIFTMPHGFAPVAASSSASSTQWSRLGSYATTLPANLTYSTPYVQEAWDDAESVGIPPGYFVRQIEQESGFRPDAVGTAGELGIAQFMPGTAQEVGLQNRLDPDASLSAATHLMSHYYSHYGNYDQALAAYNAGAPTVDIAIQKSKRYWYRSIPSTTRAYIQTITGQEVA